MSLIRYKAQLISLPLALLSPFLPRLAVANPNTEIFHEQPAATEFITFDNQSFTIMGMKTFLTCGEVHYPRIPKELWSQRLLRARMAGFNTVATYLFWNAHEPEEGQFDFSGNKDLSAFLDLCRELRLFVIVRLGPYSCSEIDLGGFPAWLAVGKGVRLRSEDPEYLKYVDRWFEKVLPIVARHQIHKGGPVIMVQLENEYPGGWGTDEDPYLAHLRKKALEMGIEVPMFYSGLRHSHDPAGEKPWPRTGNSPWFTTEFWPGWFTLFGDLPKDDVDRYDRATRKIIAFGGAGYSYYMLHGGTNWGYMSNDEISTSYDFAAPIGESGALRETYFRFKKSAIFASSFGHILTRGTTDEEGFKISSGELKHYLCRTERGNIVFLDNPGSQPVTTTVEIERHFPVPMVKPLTLQPGEILPIIVDMPLGGGVTITHCAANILTIRRLLHRTFIFIYGRQNEPGEIVFRLEGALRLISGVEGYIIDSTGRILIVSFDFPAEWERKDFAFVSGLAAIQVVVLGEKLAERTWFDTLKMSPVVVAGPHYVREITQEEKSVAIAAEFKGDEKACYIYTGDLMLPDAEKSSKLVTFEPDEPNLCLKGKLSDFPAPPEVPRLTDWKFAEAAPEADVEFDDSGWSLSDDPADMGAMPGANRSFYGWYRCSFESPEEDEGKVEFPFAGERIQVFSNGKLAAKIDGRGPQSVSIPLRKGKNIVAILARHSGRDKLYNFSGVAGLKVAAGIHGPVKLATNSGSRVLKGWRYRAGLVGEQEGWLAPDGKTAVKWVPLSLREKGAIPTFFAGSFSYEPSPLYSDILRLKTKGLSFGTLWLNGRIIGQYVPDGEYYLPEPWLEGQNLIVIADEEGKSPDEVVLVREAAAATYRTRIFLAPKPSEEALPPESPQSKN